MGNTDGFTGCSHPESRMPSPGLTQLSFSPLPSSHSLAHPVPPRKRLQLGEGPSIPSPAAACSGQRAQPGDVVVAGGGGLSGHKSLCAQPYLAAWYEAQLLPYPHPERKGEALEGLGLGGFHSSSPSVSHLSDVGSTSSGGLVSLAPGAGGLVREVPLGALWQLLLPAPFLCQACLWLLLAEGKPSVGVGAWRAHGVPNGGGTEGQAWELKCLADGSFSPVPTEWCCAQRGHQEGPEPQTRQLGQPDRVCTDERGLCRGPGQCLALPIPLLSQRGRYPEGTGQGPPTQTGPTHQGLGHPLSGTDLTPDRLASGPDLTPIPGLGVLYLRHRPAPILAVCC